MIVDERDFFRHVTMRLCSSLDLEMAMNRCFQYLKLVMPVDEMNLHLYEGESDAIRTVASVTAYEFKKMDKITPMPEKSRDILEGPHMPDVRIVNRADSDPVSGEMVQFMGKPDSSILIMRIVIEGERLGALTLRAEGEHRYNKEHAHLFSLLKEPFAIALSNALQHQEVLKLKDMLADDNRYLHKELLGISGEKIVGKEYGLRDVMNLVRQVAPLTNPVLLLGETGVGKEVIASAIHHLSPRRNNQFVYVNCGAIPETLIDSELFGHEKGAFTGATEQKRGRFERAHQGTILLDEIGELPLQAQVRMLRVLQNNEIERVGGTRPISLDIRIIASTHRDMEAMVRSHKFREDLWFRLNVFPIKIPPLRERKADIPDLVYHFVERKSMEMKLQNPPKLARGAIDLLMAYYWLGNVRELENVVERALILNKKGPLRFDHLGLIQKTNWESAVSEPEDEMPTLDEVMSSHIHKALKMTNGRVNGPKGAAKILGMNPSTLRGRMSKLRIPYRRV